MTRSWDFPPAAHSGCTDTRISTLLRFPNTLSTQLLQLYFNLKLQNFEKQNCVQNCAKEKHIIFRLGEEKTIFWIKWACVFQPLLLLLTARVSVWIQKWICLQRMCVWLAAAWSHKRLVYGVVRSGAPSSEGLAVCPSIVCGEQKWKKKNQLRVSDCGW